MENLNKSQFKVLVELSVLNFYFISNDELYLQHEGVGMSLPLPLHLWENLVEIINVHMI